MNPHDLEFGSSIAALLNRFPKTRNPLPAEFEAIYAHTYKINRDGGSTATGLAQRMEAWMHRKIAADIQLTSSKSTLEIGAGTLNHLPYEPDVIPYDIVEPFHYLFERSPNRSRVRRFYDDVSEIALTSRYDRIISIATFEHVCNLPDVIARCGTLLSEHGHLRVAIPSEGTVLWALGWHLTTGLEFRVRHGLDYGVMMRHEHVNDASEIREILNYLFSNVDCSVFGVSASMSLYQFYDCSEPNLNRCFQLLHEG
jgi:hypothetical protein